MTVTPPRHAKTGEMVKPRVAGMSTAASASASDADAGALAQVKDLSSAAGLPDDGSGSAAGPPVEDDAGSDRKTSPSRKRSRSGLSDEFCSSFVQSKQFRAESVGAERGNAEEGEREEGVEFVQAMEEEDVKNSGKEGGNLERGSEPGSSGEEADIDSCSGGSGSGECASRRAHKLRAAVVCQDGHLPPQDQQHEGDCMVASRLLQLWTVVPLVRDRQHVGARDAPVHVASHFDERVAVPC